MQNQQYHAYLSLLQLEVQLLLLEGSYFCVHQLLRYLILLLELHPLKVQLLNKLSFHQLLIFNHQLLQKSKVFNKNMLFCFHFQQTHNPMLKNKYFRKIKH